MKIIIDNVEFPFNEGCKVLKLKHGDKVPFPQLEDFWDDVLGMTFAEIAQTFVNMEQRRVAIKYLGTERLIKEVNPVLLSSETIRKTTTWINQNGELETFEFDDTYELYEVRGEVLSEGLQGNSWEKLPNAHYVRFKDTSTEREYLLWVDTASVYSTNNNDTWISSAENYGKKINPIQAIAWSIQTDVDEKDIEKIVRQGDCIMIKKKPNTVTLSKPRHLTEKEYRGLLKLES
jgi:hypothetical protein